MQSISDSCRHFTEMQYQKQQSSQPLEVIDELNYRCGDSATQQELQGSYFPNKQAAEFLSTLLLPLVVSPHGPPILSPEAKSDCLAGIMWCKRKQM